MKALHIFPVLLLSLAPPAVAQTNQEMARAMLGPPDIEAAALFNATRTTYQVTCGMEHPFDALAIGLGRLQYGSMTKQEAVEFKAIMIAQVKSNNRLWAALREEDKRGACRVMRQAITATLADAVDRYPDLFEDTCPSSLSRPYRQRIIRCRLRGAFHLQRRHGVFSGNSGWIRLPAIGNALGAAGRAGESMAMRGASSSPHDNRQMEPGRFRPRAARTDDGAHRPGETL